MHKLYALHSRLLQIINFTKKLLEKQLINF